MGQIKRDQIRGDHPEPDQWVTINEVCERFKLSRSTFYRSLADPDSGLSELIGRVPPGTGRVRVPLRGFESWLRRKDGRR